MNSWWAPGGHGRHDVAESIHLGRTGVLLDRPAVAAHVLLKADPFSNTGVVVGDAVAAGCQRFCVLAVHRFEHEPCDRLDEMDALAAAKLALGAAEVVHWRAAGHCAGQRMQVVLAIDLERPPDELGRPPVHDVEEWHRFEAPGDQHVVIAVGHDQPEVDDERLHDIEIWR